MSREKTTVTAYVGIGSNIAPGENIPMAMMLLKAQVSVCATSTFYRTRPLNDRKQPAYRNGVWRIETAYPADVLKYEILKKIEAVLKRKRSRDSYASRTIDLDLLLYGDVVSDREGLVIPDPDIYERRFIAAGISELTPDLRLPDTGLGIQTVLDRLDPLPLQRDISLTETLTAIVSGASAGEATQQQLWRLEYEELQGINLSFTETEPAPVAIFNSMIQKERIDPPRNILDIGCGKGRIGLHLAQAGYRVTGFDAVPSAVRDFRRIAKEKGIEGSVRAFPGDMNAPWKLMDRSYDCAFAITVMDNLTTTPARKHFIGELLRILAPGGLFVVECYSGGDGYYGALLKKSDRKSGLVTDPNNGMRYRIYSESEWLALFAPYFSLLHFERSRWRSIKYGRPYARESMICIYRKKDGAGRTTR